MMAHLDYASDCSSSSSSSLSSPSPDNAGLAASKDYPEMKEMMYRDKLRGLKSQLRQLNEKTLPEYLKKMRRLEAGYNERKRVNEIIQNLEVDMVEQDFINEKKAAALEFEDQKVYIREQLIAELEEKQKQIESERHSMELAADSVETKHNITTRKLRRRANEPSSSNGYGPGEKRRKPLQLSSLTYTLKDGEIIDDLKIINKNKAFSMHSKASDGGAGSAASYSAVATSGPGRGSSSPSNSSSSAGASTYHRDIRVEDGKLFYEKRWFRRGQAVLVEGGKNEKFPAHISAISADAIWVRKMTAENSKVRIYISQLVKGRYVLKRRAA